MILSVARLPFWAASILSPIPCQYGLFDTTVFQITATDALQFILALIDIKEEKTSIFDGFSERFDWSRFHQSETRRKQKNSQFWAYK